MQLLLGKGGSGKSHVLDAVITTLKENENYADENFLVMAPTGKAASNICGSTLHSNKEGLSLPIKKGYKKLSAKRLAYYQEKYKGKLKLVVIDEYTMMSQQQLHQVDLRLREIMVDEKKFGGCVVVMFGDPAQLPPVMANSLWTDVCTGDEFAHRIYYRNKIDRKQQIR